MPKLSPSFKPTNYLRGMVAEVYVMGVLMLKGYRILAWRYKTPVGEVDIVARRGRTLAFIEVKLRQSLDDGLYAVTPQMQSRITRAAEHFMVSQPRLNGAFPRFDVVSVSGFRLRHLDNAW